MWMCAKKSVQAYKCTYSLKSIVGSNLQVKTITSLRKEMKEGELGVADFKKKKKKKSEKSKL